MLFLGGAILELRLEFLAILGVVTFRYLFGEFKGPILFD